MLSSTSTKREAKSYLSRFKPPRLPSLQATRGSLERPNSDLSDLVVCDNKHGVNLGSFYRKTRAVDESPVFAQQPLPKPLVLSEEEPLHVALVKIREPQDLDDVTLKDVGLTLSQLSQLGLPSIVVVDCDGRAYDLQDHSDQARKQFAAKQTDRVVAGIDASQGPGARRIDGIISVAFADGLPGSSTAHVEKLRVTSRDSLVKPLMRSIIPVLAPIGYSEQSQQAISVSADTLMLTLTKELAGISFPPTFGEDPKDILQHIQQLQGQVSLDRLIILDPLGGIPSTDTTRRGHIFINLEQEFYDIKRELLTNTQQEGVKSCSGLARKHQRSQNADRRLGESSSSLATTSSGSALSLGADSPSKENTESSPSHLQHLDNLELLQSALAILPPSSSALLTTPREAANSGKSDSEGFQASGVGTRRQRNALIHNLLTDKPPFSSSLPVTRLGLSPRTDGKAGNPAASNLPATFVKRGLPLTIIPDPRIDAWKPPAAGGPKITLHDPCIDLSRLIDLIEDSFNRKLDIKHYLSRVNDRIAGVIIAGEYEGGALLTWETPPEFESLGNEAAGPRLVPYLDKFAVRKRSQGSGGVADIVFTAMVQGCFPDGVCWRSRKDNPVNKWYFERATGTWEISDTNWTMFWTKEDLWRQSQLFLDYAGVCRAVEPSWADKNAVVD